MFEWLNDMSPLERNVLLTTPINNKIALFHAIDKLDVPKSRVLLHFFADEFEEMHEYLYAAEYLLCGLARRIEQTILSDSKSWGISDAEWSCAGSILYMLSCYTLVYTEQLKSWKVWNHMYSEIEEARRLEVSARRIRGNLLKVVDKLHSVPANGNPTIMQKFKHKFITVKLFIQYRTSRWYRDVTKSNKKPEQVRDYVLWMRSIPGRIRQIQNIAFENRLKCKGHIRSAISMDINPCDDLLRPTPNVLELDEYVHNNN